MTVNKPHMPVASDADRDEAPELTSDFFDRAEVRDGGIVIREAEGTLTKRGRGRPPVGDAPKEQVTLRLSRDVLDHFRATGSGWTTKIDEALRGVITAKPFAARRGMRS